MRKMNAQVTNLQALLRQVAALHDHLCPRQVLGVRAGLYGAGLLDVPAPDGDKRLFAFVETDGCFADGVWVATGCSLGHRTMRLVDYGKVAVTLADTETCRAVRIAPAANSRQLAALHAADAPSAWHAQLEAYQTLLEQELFHVEIVRLLLPLDEIISRPRLRVPCAQCGEEIMNRREIIVEGRALCRRCAHAGSYYEVADTPVE